MTIRHFFTGPIDVNTYLCFDETRTAFVVDPGGPSPDLLHLLKEEQLTLAYILLTHGHADHFGGIPSLKESFPAVKILACRDEETLLEDPRLNASLAMLGQALSVRADVWVEDGDRLTIGNTDLIFRQTPGHTRGGLCILGDGFVFSGDTLFRLSVGRTDFYGGSYPDLIRSIKEVLFTLPDDTTVYPGHMETTTIGYEKMYNPFVQDGRK